MNQKTALYIALGLTTFILVAVGSVALAWPTLQKSSPPAPQPVIQEIPIQSEQAQTLAGPVSSQPANAVNEDVQALMATVEARDAAYQAQIEQANQQLKEAYRQLQELQALNQELMQREQIYQQRLQESAQIIETMATSQSSVTANASYQGEGDHDDYEEQHGDDDRYEKEGYHDDHDNTRKAYNDYEEDDD